MTRLQLLFTFEAMNCKVTVLLEIPFYHYYYTLYYHVLGIHRNIMTNTRNSFYLLDTGIPKAI